MKKLLLIVCLFAFVFPVSAQFKSVWDKIPEEVKQKNSFKRYEWFYRTRTDDNGIFPKEHINQQILLEERKIAEQNMSRGSLSTSDLWTNIGPKAIDMSSSFIPYWGNTSGRVRGLDVHPTDPNIVYIGAAAGGVWKTTNGGTTWADKSGGLSRLTFGSIAIDPNNTNTIYAGTGETIWFYNNVTYEGNGLYKSTDGGDTWTQITSGIGIQTQFSDIEVNPGDSNILLASLGSGTWENGFPGNEGIWRSTNAGASWTRTLNVDDAFDVTFHPSNSLLAYAACGNQSASGGFYRSTDGGATWTQSNTGLPSATLIGRMQFDLSTSSPLTIYSLIYNNSASFSGRNSAAFKSTDGGLNWAQISSGVLISGTYNGSTVSDQGSYDLCLSVHPTNPDIVCFGNVEVSRTTNGSAISFVRKGVGSYGGGTLAWDGYTHTDIHKIHFAPSNGNIVYLGCDGGVYKSTDAGATWSSLNNNINTIQFYRVASHPTNSSILFGGAQDNGNFSTSDKGATNWVFETSGDGMECFVDYNDPNYVFMATQNGNLLRSTDAGVNWLTADNVGSAAWVAPYWQHPSISTRIFAAINGRIRRSNTSGASGSWSYLSGLISGFHVTSVAQSAVSTSNMIAISSYYTTSPNVHKSTDEGVTWSNITTNITSAGFTGTNIQRVVADPVSANTFYITRASYGGGQVIKSTDFGTTWTNVSGNLPTVPVNDLFIDPANTSHLYAGNDFGVYWSNDGGTTWTKLSNGMPFVPVQDFSFFDNGSVRFLRAATHGRGVYELNIDSPLPVELTSFTAVTKENNILLKWVTASEVDNYGFEIERSVDQGDFKKIGFLPGHGNSNSPKEYSFTDNFVNGFLSYRLKQINNNGSYSYSNIVKVEALTVNDFAVYQNYPNPFNPITSIKFKTPVDSKVRLTITNSLGEEIESLLDEQQNPGIHEVVWDANKYSSGVYFANIKITSNDGIAQLNKTIKMILNK